MAPELNRGSPGRGRGRYRGSIEAKICFTESFPFWTESAIALPSNLHHSSTFTLPWSIASGPTTSPSVRA
jgi:hypothetical protein